LSQFKQALRALLDERHMSQAELARRLNLSPQAVSAWLTSSVTPSYEHVGRIEDELAVDPRGSLLELAGYSTNNDAEAPTVESLLRADPGLHPEDKRIFLRLIKMARERFAAESE
jgi:transcriptional regulator with XRE-family HTH domain